MAAPSSDRHLTDNPDLIADAVRTDLAYDHHPSAKSLSLMLDRLLPEEMRELQNAIALFKQVPDLRNTADLCKEAYDVLILSISLLNFLGVDIAAIARACAANNLDKLDPTTGKPNRDERGKVLKPPHCRPVDLVPIIAGDHAAMVDEYKQLKNS